MPPGVRRPINLKVIRKYWEDFLGGVILPICFPRSRGSPLKENQCNFRFGWVGNISESGQIFAYDSCTSVPKKHMRMGTAHIRSSAKLVGRCLERMS